MVSELSARGAIPASTVEAAAAGDTMAFARIVQAHHDDMARVCHVVSGDPDLAQDAVQAAWPIVWARLRTLRDPAKLRPWLVTVAANEARQLVRRQHRDRIVALEVADVGSHSGDPAMRAADTDLLAAVRLLPPEDRDPALAPLRRRLRRDGDRVGDRDVGLGRAISTLAPRSTGCERRSAMPDHDFELRLQRVLRVDAERAVRPFDAVELATSAAAAGRTARRPLDRLSAGWPAIRLVLIASLLLLAAAATLWLATVGAPARPSLVAVPPSAGPSAPPAASSSAATAVDEVLRSRWTAGADPIPALGVAGPRIGLMIHETGSSADHSRRLAGDGRNEHAPGDRSQRAHGFPGP